jgi:protein-L-isoaspartate(D-aspartate) O-methyltransferase
LCSPGAAMNATEPPNQYCRLASGTMFVLLVVVMIDILLHFRPNVFQNPIDSMPTPDVNRGTPTDDVADDPFAKLRRSMVDEQLRDRDIVDPRVLKAMGRVPRERFIPGDELDHAYGDYPLPIGHGQTISQPYIVALMTQLAKPKPGDRALEVGVGCGYQTAILAELCQQVYGIEILEPLAAAATERLASLGYNNVVVHCGDGYRGWPEHSPFDVILVTAAPDEVPPPLIEQLAPGGRLVIPLGSRYQDLVLIQKRLDGTVHRSVIAPVRFVPMTGESQHHRANVQR